MILETARVATPIGSLDLFVGEGVLRGLALPGGRPALVRHLQKWHGALELHDAAEPVGVAERLAAYFAGDLRALAAIAAQPPGTPFQQRVWAALREIPAGTTVSYSELARRVGEPQAVRAVGAANGRNPVPIVIPCHRVIGADGSLVGYGGGLERKRWLLEHEGALVGGAHRLSFAGTS